MSDNTPLRSDAAPADRQLPWGVAILGIVSFLTDLSSEAIFAILPIYFVGVLGGSTFVLGVMEGLADFAASSLDLVSGRLADRTGQRKWIAFSGYSLSTLGKSFLVLSATVGSVIAFRVIDRLGKSIRGAPRDALLSSLAPQGRRGLSFGLHKALDKSGAVIGPFAAYLILSNWGATLTTFHSLFFYVLIPAVVAIGVMGFFVKDRAVSPVNQRESIRETLSRLGQPYWRYVLCSAVFSLGYFSFAFLVLKARSVGFTIQDQVLLYGLFNVVFTIVSVPIGWVGDRVGQRVIVIISYLTYAGMAIGLMLSDSPFTVGLMFIVYGVFYAMNEGQSKAYLSDLSDEDTRATAIGIYGFVTGLLYLPASLIAGALWTFDSAWTFGFAIATSATALTLFLLTSDRKTSGPFVNPQHTQEIIT